MLTAHAPIQPLRWLMFVELPIDEATTRRSTETIGAIELPASQAAFRARRSSRACSSPEK